MDASFDTSLGPVLQNTALVDSDYSHNLTTCTSITGHIGYIGSIPDVLSSRRQDHIDSSTYTDGCSALYITNEETQSLCYILHCLDINIPFDCSSPVRISGDNSSVTLNSQNPAIDHYKKHVAIFHVFREAVAAGIIMPY